MSHQLHFKLKLPFLTSHAICARSFRLQTLTFYGLVHVLKNSLRVPRSQTLKIERPLEHSDHIFFASRTDLPASSVMMMAWSNSRCPTCSHRWLCCLVASVFRLYCACHIKLCFWIWRCWVPFSNYGFWNTACPHRRCFDFRPRNPILDWRWFDSGLLSILGAIKLIQYRRPHRLIHLRGYLLSKRETRIMLGPIDFPRVRTFFNIEDCADTRVIVYRWVAFVSRYFANRLCCRWSCIDSDFAACCSGSVLHVLFYSALVSWTLLCSVFWSWGSFLNRLELSLLWFVYSFFLDISLDSWKRIFIRNIESL